MCRRRVPPHTVFFAPLNYDRRCYGPMRYRLALANSLNISAVRVLDSVGGPAVLRERLEQCGLTTLKHPSEFYGLGLTIGNAEARLLELANAYACIARLGEFEPVRLAANTSGAIAQRVFDPDASFLIADILSDNFTRALAFGRTPACALIFPSPARPAPVRISATTGRSVSRPRARRRRLDREFRRLADA